jgi:hypothetical protein
MGTNYYLVQNVCEHCGRADEPLHIGKSSYGWCFALQVTEDVHSLEDWLELWSVPNTIIKNEYNDVIEPDQMLNTITKRNNENNKINSGLYGYKDMNDFHLANHSEDGPNNLVRAKIDGYHCVGHGEGTWDLITGDFS